MQAIDRFARSLGFACAVVGASALLPLSRAVAEDVRDPASGVSFWAPDGWTSHTDAQAKTRVLRRTSPDGRAMVGLLVGEVPGDAAALRAAVEALWRTEGAVVEWLGETGGGTGSGPFFPALSYRLQVAGKSLSATAHLRWQGDLKVVLYEAHDPALDATWASSRERILGSLVVPRLAAPAPAKTPAPDEAATRAAPSPAAAPPAAGSGLLFDPAFREGRPAEALLRGGVPLLRGDLDALVDAVEAGWDTATTAAEEQALRDGVESSWARWKSDAQDLVKRATVAKAAALGALSRGDVAAARTALKGYAAEWQARADAAGAASWAEALRTARTRRVTLVAVAGEPPVSAAAMDALEATASFLLSLARNDATTVTDGQRVAVREEARKTFGAAGPLVRGRYAAAHRLWLLVKARWDASDASQRLRARFAAVAAARRLAHAAPWTPAHPEDEGLKGYARAAAATAAASPLFDAYTAAFANPEVLFNTALEVAGVDPRDLDKALAAEPITLR